MTTTVTEPGRLPMVPARTPARVAFWAMLVRDFTVLRRELKGLVPIIFVQPLLLIFLLSYILPVIGQPVGGGYVSDTFATVMMAGIVAQAAIMQGIFRVAVPTVRELSITRELEDRVLAPTRVSLIAIEKIVFGAFQSMWGALVVLPVAALLPATTVYLKVDWPVLLVVAPLSFYTSAALGLALGTLFNPRSISSLSHLVILPMSFGGAVFYTWASLEVIPWLQYLVLLNPLVYMAEGFRAALVANVYHMPLWAVFSALTGFAVVCTIVGIIGFRRRVLM